VLRRILVPLDGTTLAEQALPYATELAKAVGGSVVLVHATETHPHLLGGRHLEDARAYLTQQVQRLQATGLTAELAAARDRAPDGVVSEVRHQQPHLVVVATGPPGLGSRLFGGLAEAIIAAHVVPVLLVGEHVQAGQSRPPLRGTRVLVPLDGSALGEAALPTALELARVLHSEIVLFQAVAVPVVPYAVPPELTTRVDLDVELAWEPSFAVRAAKAYLELVANRLAREADGVRIDTAVRVGELAEQIRRIRTASAAGDPTPPGLGLIVMASHARRGLGRLLLGSTTAELAEAVDVPVVAVPVQHASESFAPLPAERAA
jgi:nucleotide-binding universal stress UspA family protein